MLSTRSFQVEKAAFGSHLQRQINEALLHLRCASYAALGRHWEEHRDNTRHRKRDKASQAQGLFMIAEPQKAPKGGVTHQSLSVDNEQVQRGPRPVGQGPRRLSALCSPVLPADVPTFFDSTCRASYLLAVATWESGSSHRGDVPAEPGNNLCWFSTDGEEQLVISCKLTSKIASCMQVYTSGSHSLKKLEGSLGSLFFSSP